MISLSDYIVEGLLDNKLLKPLRNFIQKNFKKRVGFKEKITVGIQGDKYEFTATIDTGNGGVVPTLGVDKMNINGDKVTITIGDKDYTFDKKGEASPTVGNVVHHRPIIIIDYIKIGGRKLDEPFIAVTDERKKSTKTLINRDTMSKLNLVVDPSKNNLISEKLKIDNTSGKIVYKYHPKTRSELVELLLQLKEERGNDADLNDIDVSKVTDMNALFYEGFRQDCENIDISKWDVSKVTNMNSMFYRCYHFNCDLSKWDVSHVTDMAHMFEYCREFDISTTKPWNVNARGKKVQDMFHGCALGDVPEWWWEVSK